MKKSIEQKKVPTSLAPFLKKVSAKTPMQTTATKTPTKAKTTTKGPTFPSATFTTRKVAHSDPLTTHLAVVAVSESQPEPDFFKGSKSPQKTRPKEQVLFFEHSCHLHILREIMRFKRYDNPFGTERPDSDTFPEVNDEGKEQPPGDLH